MSFDFTAFLLLYICVGIAIGYFIDDFALLTKSFGGLYKSNAIASNLGSIIYLVNRVFIAMTLPALGFIIDSGVEIDVIVITLIVSSLLLVFFKILAYSKIFKIILLLKWFAEKIYGKNESGTLEFLQQLCVGSPEKTIKFTRLCSSGTTTIMLMILILSCKA